MENPLEKLISHLKAIKNEQFQQEFYTAADDILIHDPIEGWPKIFAKPCGCIAHHWAILNGKIPHYSEDWAADGSTWGLTQARSDLMKALGWGLSLVADVNRLTAARWPIRYPAERHTNIGGQIPTRRQAIAVLEFLRDGRGDLQAAFKWLREGGDRF